MPQLLFHLEMLNIYYSTRVRRNRRCHMNYSLYQNILSSYSQIKNMNAKALKLSPMLETKDMQATLKFYTEVLGFKCDTFSEEWGWAHFSKDEISIMFSKPNE